MKKRINYALLRKIRATILRRPKQIEMQSWFESREGAGACNTTACLAGWAITLHTTDTKRPLDAAKALLKNFRFDEKDYWHIGAGHVHKIRPLAKRLLGLTDKQADRLFSATAWPLQFHDQLWEAKGSRIPKRYAQVVAERIDHFIKTKGAE